MDMELLVNVMVVGVLLSGLVGLVLFLSRPEKKARSSRNTNSAHDSNSWWPWFWISSSRDTGSTSHQAPHHGAIPHGHDPGPILPGHDPGPMHHDQGDAGGGADVDAGGHHGGWDAGGFDVGGYH